MHMNPDQLDSDQILSGKLVRAGDVIGKVGNYNDGERGTTYHLHFDMQVPTKLGWVFVNPYMTLVSAYERLINGRGREIKDGDAMPPVVGAPPIILHKSEQTTAGAKTGAARTEGSAAVRLKSHKSKAKVHKKRHSVQRRASVP